MEVTEPTNENETPGDKPGTVTSEDGFTRITDFEVMWVGVQGRRKVSDVSFNSNSRTAKQINGINIDINETHDLQVNWAISGERFYEPGKVKINLQTNAQLGPEDGIVYRISNYPVPPARFNDDGSINFNYKYGSASFAYVVDGETTYIVNVSQLAPGNSGTFTIAYKGEGEILNTKKENVASFNPFISIRIDDTDEVISKYDEPLELELTRELRATHYKQGGSVNAEWDSSWGNEAKAEDYQDYIYIRYYLTASLAGTELGSATVKDLLPTDLEVVGYKEASESKFIPLTQEDPLEWNISYDEEAIKNFDNPNKYLAIRPSVSMGIHLLVKVPKTLANTGAYTRLCRTRRRDPVRG